MAAVLDFAEQRVPRFRRRLIPTVVPLAAAATLLAACGGDESPATDPEAVLEEASITTGGITSGVLEAEAEMEILAGQRSVKETLALRGPFTRQPGEAPRFHLEGALSTAAVAGGREQADFALVAADDGAWLEFGGEAYEVAPEVRRRFEHTLTEPGAGGDPAAPAVDLGRWFTDPVGEGAEQIGGVETVHVSGTADVALLAEQLGAAAASVGLPRSGSELSEVSQDFFDGARIELWAGSENNVPQRIELELRWSSRLEGGEPFDGVIRISAMLSELGETQEVERPASAQPMRGSVNGLPHQLSGLGEFLAGRHTESSSR